MSARKVTKLESFIYRKNEMFSGSLVLGEAYVEGWWNGVAE